MAGQALEVAKERLAQPKDLHEADGYVEREKAELRRKRCVTDEETGYEHEHHGKEQCQHAESQ